MNIQNWSPISRNWCTVFTIYVFYYLEFPSGSWVLSPGTWMLDPGSQMNPGCKIMDQDPQFLTIKCLAMYLCIYLSATRTIHLPLRRLCVYVSIYIYIFIYTHMPNCMSYVPSVWYITRNISNQIYDVWYTTCDMWYITYNAQYGKCGVGSMKQRARYELSHTIAILWHTERAIQYIIYVIGYILCRRKHMMCNTCK